MLIINFINYFDVMTSKRLINLASILDLSNYINSLERWLSISSLQINLQKQQRFINDYIRIVKPQIHRYHHIVTTLDEKSYSFYSDCIHKNQIQVLKNAYKQLEKFQIFAKEDLNELHQLRKYTFLSEEQFKILLIKPTTNLFRLPLKQQPKNDEYNYWNTYLNIEKCEFNSVVIHGKGIAKTVLGFPTANLQVTEEILQKLSDHPNGIYLVEFNFKKGDKYIGVCCIGTNPHYQNLLHSRIIQTYVYHDFQNDFYGEEVSIKLLIITRFQGKFQNFDNFLNAMHNDIYMGMKIAKQLKYIEN